MPKPITPEAQQPTDLEAALGQQLDANPATPESPEGPEGPEAPEEKSDEYKGAGSKEQLKSDLAGERKKRQELEARVDQLTAGLTQALGIKGDEGEKLTPEQLTEQLKTASAERDAASRQLTVFLNAPDGVDVKALLDSRSFLDHLDKAAPSSPEEISTAVASYVAANPRFKVRSGSLGDIAAGHGRQSAPVAPGMDRLTAAISQQLTKN